MENTKINFNTIILFVLLAIIFIFISFNTITTKINNLKEDRYIEVATLMKKELQIHIAEKQENILNMAMSLAENKVIKESLLDNNHTDIDLKQFSLKLRENTTLKNIWFQVLTSDGISFYRSWTTKRNDDMKKARIDIGKMVKEPKITTTISTGKYDLTFKAMVPIYHEGKFIGIFESIAKFNSVAIKMANKGYETVIVVDKRYKNQIIKPFSKTFIEDYYIANINVKQRFLDIIKSKKVEYFLEYEKEFHIDRKNNSLISLYSLPDIDNKNMAYFIMFHDLSNINMDDIIQMRDYLIFLFSAIFLIGLALVYYFYIKKYRNFIEHLNIELEQKVKDKTKTLHHLAHHDSLTNLPNRILFADRLHQAMLHTHRTNKKVIVAYLDLDGFKEVNDTYGHHIGDILLIEISERMKLILREDDSIARLGGDEFAILLSDFENVNSSIVIVERLLKTVAEPVAINNLFVKVSVSIGLTSYPQSEEIDADQLLRQSDQAMYQAKLSGKNKYHILNPDKDIYIRERNEKLKNISLAIDNDEFIMYYQPKVNLRTGQVIGVEALIRWQHVEEGLLLPALFLPDIEGDHLNIVVDEMVVNKVFSQSRAWMKDGLSTPISINISAAYIQEKDFVDRFKAIVSKYEDIALSNIQLEILETSSIDDMSHVSKVISTLNKMGVEFSLDDFGTGYSSLTYLRNLPVQTLKIDQSFVRDMLDDSEDFAIVDGVIGLASSFNKDVLAEGIEDIAQGTMLLRLGCELAQGYAIAKPMPANDFPNWIKSWKTEPSWNNINVVEHDKQEILFVAIEHRAWVKKISDILHGKIIDTMEMEENECRFGKWLKHMDLKNSIDLQEIKTLHSGIHTLANELILLNTQDQNNIALDNLPKLYNLRDKLLFELESLLEKPLSSY